MGKPKLSGLKTLLEKAGKSPDPSITILSGLLDHIEENHKLDMHLSVDKEKNMLEFKPIPPSKEYRQVLTLLAPILRDKYHKLHEKLVARAKGSHALDPDFVGEMLNHHDSNLTIPYIKSSPLVSETQMKSLIELGTNSQRFALCERPNLPRPIIDILLQEGDAMMVIALLCNGKIAFTKSQIRYMEEMHKQNHYFQQAVAARIASNMDHFFTFQMDVIKKGPLPAFADDLDPRIIDAFLARKLMPERILASAILGDANAIIQLFALYGLISVKNATQLLYEETEGLRILYSHAKLDRHCFELFKQAWVFGWSNPGPKNRDDQKVYLFNRTQELLEEYPELVERYQLKGSTDFSHRFNQNCASPALRHLNFSHLLKKKYPHT
ncbi:MAG: hypothetical protein AB8B77_05060, partial [Alphaproteobacteria bacterium]